MPAQTLDELATQLGRPPGTLAPFRDMKPEQIVLLSEAINRACARQRERLDSGEGAAWYARRLVRLVIKFFRR